MIKKAMVLAAGLGTRLRPLTEQYPKPLVPIANEPLLGIHLRQLAAWGVEEVMVNLHHLPDEIQRALGDGREYGVKLHYSLEQPEILGTGGGLAKVADFFAGEEAFFFINGDILHDIDMMLAYDAVKTQGAAAALVLRPHPQDGKTGWIGVESTGQQLAVKRVPEMPEDNGTLDKWMFTGLHVLTPQIFPYLDVDQFGCVIRTGYRRMIEAGIPVIGFDATGSSWRDIGTPASYLDANCWRLQRGADTSVSLGAGVILGEGASLGECVAVGDGASIGAHAKLSRCVVLPEATVAPHDQRQNAIIMKDRVIQVD